MFHPLVTFELLLICPLHTTTRPGTGYLARATGFRDVKFILRQVDMGTVATFRKAMLSQGSFHCALNAHEYEKFMVDAIRECGSAESRLLSEVESELLTAAIA